MLKKSLLFGLFIIFTTLVTGCNSAKTTFKPGAAGEISVLSLRGNTSDMTQDQIIELKRVGAWMDRDIIKQLNRAGYTAKLLKSRSDFSGSGHLLIIDVDKFNPGNRTKGDRFIYCPFFLNLLTSSNAATNARLFLLPMMTIITILII